MSYDRDRYDRDRYERERAGRDRGPLDRAGDEVRSWFGDEDASRRRERDAREHERWNRPDEDRWRGASYSERSYVADRPYGERDYSRTEGYREYGDRYGRGYSAPVEREREFDRGPAFQPYARGSQEFGSEGYGSARSYESATIPGREFRSTETWRASGPFRGRGPKGYQRSDERIREDLCDRLTAHGLVDATDIEVTTRGGEVTLSGFVDSRDAKRAAEDCAEEIPGVREVHNQLRIRSHAEEGGVGRTSVLGLTEHEMQTAQAARQADAATRSRARNT